MKKNWFKIEIITKIQQKYNTTKTHDTMVTGHGVTRVWVCDTAPVPVTPVTMTPQCYPNLCYALDGKMMQKQKHSTKFDFSGTNYEIQTLGYLAGIEEECKLDPNLIKKICKKAKKANGAQKPAGGDHEVKDKFASIWSDPAFLARTSLRAKMSGRVIFFKTENGKNGKLYKIDNADEVPANSQDKSNLT